MSKKGTQAFRKKNKIDRYIKLTDWEKETLAIEEYFRSKKSEELQNNNRTL